MDEPACTMVNVKKFQILHPIEDRVISIAEAMALQGIPEWYIPVGTETDQALQVANAMPPRLAYYIAKTLSTPFQRRL
jgi:DNA (cytosine-5)-methyltransferase 1